MLETLCNVLSDEAQLKLALRIGKMALPVWNNHFKQHPEAIDRVNGLIGDSNRLKRGADKIDIGFPERALEKIERSYAAAKEKAYGNPIPLMKSDATLAPLLATCMQPLTNKEWDNTLPQSVRLVFTLLFNILTWLQFRRMTPYYETHIYVAINMGVDALLRESLQSVDDLNRILDEYRPEVRSDTEDAEWENAFRVGESEPMDQEDVFRRILGEPVNKDLCGPELAKEVLRQMREEGKSYWNMMDEYETGTSTTYSYNKEKQSFWRHEFDAIVGSFSNDIPMTEKEMQLHISRQQLHDLRESGFEV